MKSCIQSQRLTSSRKCEHQMHQKKRQRRKEAHIYLLRNMKTPMNLNQQSLSVIVVRTVNNNDLSIDVNSLMVYTFINACCQHRRLFINAAFKSVTCCFGVSERCVKVFSSEYTILLVDSRLNYVTECTPFSSYLQCDIRLLTQQSVLSCSMI